MTIYGVIDQGYQSSKATFGSETAKQTRISDDTQSTSRLGFKGTEDLGGGLKANFVVEMALSPSEAGLIGTNRQSFISLGGNFGTATVGRQYTLHHSNQSAGDMVGNIVMAGYIGNLDRQTRISNAITYKTPSISGFTAAVQVGIGETVTDSSTSKQNEMKSFGVAYANGPLALGIAHEKVKNGSELAVKLFDEEVIAPIELDDRKVTNLSASYDFGVAKVGFVNNNSKFTETLGSGSAKWKANTVSASAPIGAFTLLASVGTGKLTADGVTGEIKAKAYQLGASYALSKRTNAYAFQGETKFTPTGTPALKLSQFTVGMRHSF